MILSHQHSSPLQEREDSHFFERENSQLMAWGAHMFILSWTGTGLVTSRWGPREIPQPAQHACPVGASICIVTLFVTVASWTVVFKNLLYQIFILFLYCWSLFSLCINPFAVRWVTAPFTTVTRDKSEKWPMLFSPRKSLPPSLQPKSFILPHQHHLSTFKQIPYHWLM